MADEQRPADVRQIAVDDLDFESGRAIHIGQGRRERSCRIEDVAFALGRNVGGRRSRRTTANQSGSGWGDRPARDRRGLKTGQPLCRALVEQFLVRLERILPFGQRTMVGVEHPCRNAGE